MSSLSTLPRVSVKMTLPELKQELLSRKPNLRGTSNKTKAWFLEQLGVGSVCELDQDLENLKVVTPDLTVSQLTAELRTRQPKAKLSGRRKAWLLDQLVVGTVLIAKGRTNEELKERDRHVKERERRILELRAAQEAEALAADFRYMAISKSREQQPLRHTSYSSQWM